MEEFNKENMLKWLNQQHSKYEDQFKKSDNYEEQTLLNGKMFMIEKTVTYISRTYINK